ncbi:hypothetical protein ANCCAN_04336 [Ancylostoma caninum]|uniref:Uncharacterized protein n=1 Tax=Ancylostoma caninum TaxID=29170 RepID=A0A368GYZ9_ANCCA|nr:hypothetical protein ANCCAN_04336 [Ancylostoma caninum]
MMRPQQVMNRAILSLCRNAPVLRRALHKGVDSTPPLRWTSVGERVRHFHFICLPVCSFSIILTFFLLLSHVSKPLFSSLKAI